MPTKAIEMVLTNRSFVLRTILGHSIAFEKDVPVNVPPSIVNQALAIGATPTDGKNPIEAPPTEPVVPVDPIQRQREIRAVITEMVTENNRSDFTASGNPKVSVVSKRIGYRIDSRELGSVLNKMNQETEDAN